MLDSHLALVSLQHFGLVHHLTSSTPPPFPFNVPALDLHTRLLRQAVFCVLRTALFPPRIFLDPRLIFGTSLNAFSVSVVI